ncbi:MAG: hypothetical protein HYU30_02120 [Chloroflexi bacterium]|nr:hypothetical protein [Chloroflexota bacterium]MBI4198633.1 hypothetical protein [Chloroflexota bacterium]
MLAQPSGITPHGAYHHHLPGRWRCRHTDGPLSQAHLHEPGGLSIASGRIFIADADTHAVRMVDMARGEVSTLELKGL